MSFTTGTSGFKGRKHSPATKAKIAAAMRARTLTPEHRARIAAANAGQDNPSGDQHHAWKGTAVGYVANHKRIRRARGRASTHACVDCGQSAEEWSLDPQPGSPAVIARDGRSYSTDPADYKPRCVPCHRHFDRVAAIA